MFRALVASLAAVLLLPSGALAAGKPAVTTGGVADVTFQSARLTGKVNPSGAATTIYFQYGTTTKYGAQTAPVPVGAGTTTRTVVADIAGLTGKTTYHYRLVAENSHGVVSGADRSFTTKAQPLGLTLVATPNPVPFGGATTLSGTLTGTGSAGRAVILQGNPFPYTAGFAPVGNPQLTNAQGAFAFPLLSVPINTQYRVLVQDKPSVQSPIVNVGVAVRVSTHVHTTRRSAHSIVVRFSGTVRPARDGAQVAFQKARHGTWVTIGGTITHHGGTSFSRYSKHVTIRRGGTFRVLVGIVDGNFVSNAGRSVRLHVH
jgi:hypothetical protein